MKTYDAVVVGGGHNGLVAAGYLAQTGLSVLLVERRDGLGGPAGRREFMKGYYTSITNSPGSLEPKIVRELGLEQHGLRFARPDVTLVHPFTDGRVFRAWRDRARTSEQFESYAAGESERYAAIHAYLESFAHDLDLSLFKAPPSLQKMVARVKSLSQQEAFSRIFFGSAIDLFEHFGLAPETQAILGPLAVVSGHCAPSTPGTPLNLMFRPLSLASVATDTEADPRLMPLRGSTGLPIGGMGSIIDALESAFEAAGGEVLKETGVAQVRTKDGAVEGITTDAGMEIDSAVVVSAISPHSLVMDLVEDDTGAWSEIRRTVEVQALRGKAFKVVLALGDLPRYAAATSDDEALAMASAQFRIAPTIEYLDEAHLDMMAGREPLHPVIWGLCPTATSPDLAPPGKHLLSLNIGNAPYDLRDATWSEARDRVVARCIETLAEWIPNLPAIVEDAACLDPTDFERDYGLVGANITHGDLLPGRQFWMRPAPGLHEYRTPTRGLYVSGNGTWPGNFVSGIAGHNTSHVVIEDLRRGLVRPVTEWSVGA